jgi:D-alanyl-D-alanine endopeptidase (penicillin-binding protein 7)
MNRGHGVLALAFVQLLFTGSLACAAGQTSTTAAHAKAVRVHTHRVRISADEPGVRSSAALVLDETHSSVLYSRRADVAMPIASITKLVSALVVADAQQPLDEVVEISPEDRISGKGAYSRLLVGTKLSRGELIHLALMSSENRAAHALARNYPGGMPAFVQAMNAKARELGMTSSHFVDPAGLSSENVASPEDLSKLVSAAAQNATIREYSTDEGYAVRVGRRMLEFRNTNPLVASPTWNIIVQKTGYTVEAGKCLVMQAVIEGRTVLIVLLNSVGKYTRVADAARIRRWMEMSAGGARDASRI